MCFWLPAETWGGKTVLPPVVTFWVCVCTRARTINDTWSPATCFSHGLSELNYFFPPSQWYLIFTYLLLLVYLPYGSIFCTLYLNMALWISHLPITASSTGKCTHAHSHSGQSRSSSISVWSNVCRMCQNKTQPLRPRLATHRSHWPDASISSTRTHKLVWLSFFFQLKHLRRFGCFQGKADRN